MNPHESYEILCAVAASGRASAEEREKLSSHVQECEECCARLRDFAQLLPGGPKHFLGHVVVPSDPSSAAFFLVGALGAARSSLLLREVGVNPTRAGLLLALERMGATVKREGEREISGEPIAETAFEDEAADESRWTRGGNLE